MENITAHPDDPMKKGVGQFRGRLLLVDGDFYLSSGCTGVASKWVEFPIYIQSS